MNGNKYEVKLHDYGWDDYSLEKKINLLTKVLADKLANTMLQHLFENITREERKLLINETYNNCKT
jgi:hypothetical protein